MGTFTINPITGEFDITGGTGGGSPGGSDTQIQFNDSGSFGGDADLTWDKAANVLGINGNIVLSPDVSTTVREIEVGDQTITDEDGNLLVIYAGQGNGTGNGGEAALYGGDGGLSGGTGGTSGMSGGNGGTDGNGGLIHIISGGGDGIGNSGSVLIDTGNTGVTGNGGNITLNSGLGGATSGNGGNLNGSAGDAVGGGTGGNLDFSAGDGADTGNGGFAQFVGGQGGGNGGVGGAAGFFAGNGSGGGGELDFFAGNGLAGDTNGGDIVFGVGSKSGSGTDGRFKFFQPGTAIAGILDFDSLASTDKTFTFPNASGTITIFDANYRIFGDSSNPYLRLSDSIGTQLGYGDTSIILGGSSLGFIINGSSKASFATSSLTADRTYTFPNQTATIATVTSGTAAPATTPVALGQIFVDTNAAKVYISTGISSSGDWKIMN